MFGWFLSPAVLRNPLPIVGGGLAFLGADSTALIVEHVLAIPIVNGNFRGIIVHVDQPSMFVCDGLVGVHFSMASCDATPAQPYEVRWEVRTGETVRSHTPMVQTTGNVVE